MPHPNSPLPIFPHRKRSDGAYDSICRYCFITVATAANEDDLLAAEDTHICAQADLNHLRMVERLATQATSSTRRPT